MPSPTPTEPPFIPSARASALESSTRSESKNAFSAVLSTEGRVVGLCWAKLKPKGPKGDEGVLCSGSSRSRRRPGLCVHSLSTYPFLKRARRLLPTSILRGGYGLLEPLRLVPFSSLARSGRVGKFINVASPRENKNSARSPLCFWPRCLPGSNSSSKVFPVSF